MVNIQQNIILAPYTTFRIGGPARYFTEVGAEEELTEALKYAQNNKLEVFVLGGGSNVLVSDRGFDGLVIRLKSATEAQLLIEHKLSLCSIEFWAGSSLASAVNFAKNNSLSGLEWAAGIPGTIGGAVRGNAGAFGAAMSDNVESIRALDRKDFNIVEFDSQNCNFSYRSSIFKENKHLVVLSTRLKFTKGNGEEISSKIKEIIDKRVAVQPQGVGSAGSFFENPLVTNSKLVKQFEEDANCPCRGNKIPAGWLIDEAGLRGKKIGKIQVSEKHANFVINLGGGRAEDVVILISLIKQKVREKFGVELRSEVEFVGF